MKDTRIEMKEILLMQTKDSYLSQNRSIWKKTQQNPNSKDYKMKQPEPKVHKIF